MNRLVRLWYEQVQDESMAPARMVEFMQNHIGSCDTCLSDPHVKYEVEKIKKILFSSSKVNRALKKEAVADAGQENPGPVQEEENLNDEDDIDPLFMED
ncbi:MAG: hypothetical protein ACQES8_00760 [Thermodesulfobacteriota bacterium]